MKRERRKYSWEQSTTGTTYTRVDGLSYYRYPLFKGTTDWEFIGPAFKLKTKDLFTVLL